MLAATIGIVNQNYFTKLGVQLKFFSQLNAATSVLPGPFDVETVNGLKTPTTQPARTCQFRTPGGQSCKRRIAAGEAYCWQHASGWRRKIKSLSRNQILGLGIAMGSLTATLVLGVPAIYWHYQGADSYCYLS
jgi:hypothetical protein